MLSYLALLIGLITLTWSLSILLQFVFKKEFGQYTYMVLSSLLLVSSFATLKCRGNSILIFTLILVFSLLIAGKRGQPKFDFRSLIVAILVAAPLSLGIGYFQLTETGLLAIVQNHDNLYNSQMANFLITEGKESVNWNYFNPSIVKNSPYHYFESWLIGLLAWTSGLNLYYITVLCVIPYFTTLIVMGGREILNQLHIRQSLRWSAILLPFFSGLYFFPFSKIPFFAFAFKYAHNAIDTPWALKMSVLYLILLLFVNLALSKNLLAGLMALMFMPFLSIVSTPIALSSAFFLILILAFIPSWKMKKWHLAIPFLVLFSIAFFYSGPDEGQGLSVPRITDFLDSFLRLFSKRRIVILVEHLVYIVVLYLPFILAIAMSFGFQKEKLRKLPFSRSFPLILFFSFTFISSLIFGNSHLTCLEVQNFFSLTVCQF